MYEYMTMNASNKIFSLRYVNYPVVYFSKSAWFMGGFYSTSNQLLKDLRKT